MTAVTGASGHLGRLTVHALLARGVAPGEIVAAVRDPGKADDLAALGVEVREADYSRPDTLDRAFAGVDRIVFVSGSEVGHRLDQHRNVIEAAGRAGVGLIAYTSAPHADTTPMKLAREHRATEEMLAASGVPYVLLRNGWYTENYTRDLATTLGHGVILGSAGEGRVSAAARADYAEAAAAVMTSEGHAGKIYELGGDASFTLAELAAEITRLSGTEVVYRDLPVEAYTAALVGFGLPEAAAEIYADADAAIARGALLTETGDLRRLIGRPTTPLAETLAVALAEVAA